MIKKQLILTFIICIWGSISFAQTESEFANLYIKESHIEEQLPTLAELQEKAIQNSPRLKINDADIIIAKQQLLRQKRDWQNYIGLEGGAKYGLFDNLVLTQELGTEAVSTATTEQSRYYIGAYLKLPMASIFDKSNVKIAKAENQRVLNSKIENTNTIKQLVVTQYYNIVRAHRSVILRVNAVESYRIQMIRAKLDFENSIIPISEYARLNDMLIKALISLEESKVEYEVAIHLLEQTIGEKIELKTLEN